MAGEAAGDLPEQGRDGGEVEEPVARGPATCVRSIELGKDRGDLGKGRVIVVVAAHVPEAPHELAPGGLGVGDGLEAVIAELVVRPLGPGDADEHEAVGQRPVAGQRRQCRKQLARGQIARRAEHHERERRGLCLGPLRGHEGGFSPARTTAWPPNWFRKAASNRRP